jgi:hypothetical protein
MTAVTLPAAHAAAPRAALGQLARIEARRFARHPLFLVGSALGLWVVWWIGSEDEGPARLDFQAVPAFFVGVLGFVVAVRLTRSTRSSREVIDGAPVPGTVRTAALCLACLVPFTAGLVLIGLHLALAASTPSPDWMYGTYGPVDEAMFKAVLPAIACLGGPLLGVAVGRWLRFPGAALLGVVALLAGGALLGYAPQDMDSSALLTKVLHVLPPWTPFGSENGDGVVPTTEVTSYTGAPVRYGLYLLALCGLAVTAALWRDAEGATRRAVGRTFVGLAVLAVALVGAAAVGGNDQSMVTTPDGVSRPAPTD